MSGTTFRQNVEFVIEEQIKPRDPPLTQIELTEIQVGKFNPDDPNHGAVFDRFDKNISLPISWDESLEIWIEERNKANARPITTKTIQALKRNIEAIKVFGLPRDVTKDTVRLWINKEEQRVDPISVQAGFKILQSIFAVLMKEDKVLYNPFQAVGYSVSKMCRR